MPAFVAKSGITFECPDLGTLTADVVYGGNYFAIVDPQENYAGIQADIFATGIIIFIMYNGTPPFLSTKPHDRIYKLIRDRNYQKFWGLHEKNKKLGFYPDSFKRLMNSFFSADPERRPNFESLENDEWMKGDEFMGNDLFEYMQKKANHLFEKDENKQKMAAIKKELYMKKGINYLI